MRQHLFQEPPPLPEQVTLPEELRLLLRRMMAKEPSLRPRMAEAAERLQGLERSTLAEGLPLARAVPETHGSVSRAPADTTGRSLDSEGVPTLAERRSPSSAPLAPRRRWGVLASGAGVALVTVAAAAWFTVRAFEKPRAVAPTLDGMVRLPGGHFRMGSTPEELEAECARDQAGCTPDTRKRLERELPAHDVTLSSFQLDRYEVTQAQLAAFLSRVAPSLDVREDRDDHSLRFVYDRASGLLLADLYPRANGVTRTAEGRFAVRPGLENKPAVQVTWDGASRYCQFLGKRLPTEAEWEVRRAGSGPSGLSLGRGASSMRGRPVRAHGRRGLRAASRAPGGRGHGLAGRDGRGHP